ncbi:Large tegument protein deneddylase [Frankliniella fusca]|uniref:Large tegument protein deneddylase n=1 Tax=Frankliniella fusca TaxID=407009 RepID=A0AAE1LFW3_9NEOP|nr:Large tegument protein deneddylase [Frankliniella fusca]
MAATQAEHHQHKEVIREQAQQPEQPQDVAGPGLQNGTEKNGGRDNVSGKAKLPVGPKSSLLPGLEMSQYRQESGAGPPGNVNSDQGGNSGDVDSAKINSDGSGKPFPPNSEAPGGDPGYGKLPDNATSAPGPGPGPGPGYGGAGAGYPGSRGGYPHLDQHPGSNNSDLHHPYGPPGMRHHFPGKPQAAGPMIPPRPLSGGANSNSPGAPFSPHGQQQRFMSGQSISQPTGPTPTLNQLLQASNPVHRYPNSYGDMNMQKPGEQGPAGYGYNQWPSSYPGQHIPPGYRNQSPLNIEWC